MLFIDKEQCLKFLTNFIVPFISYGQIKDDSSKILTPMEIIEKYLMNNSDELYSINLISVIVANLNAGIKESVFTFIQQHFTLTDILEVYENFDTSKEGDEDKLINLLTFWIN